MSFQIGERQNGMQRLRINKGMHGEVRRAVHDGNYYRWLKRLDDPDFHMVIQIADLHMTKVMEKVCHKTLHTIQSLFDQAVVLCMS
jgi:hypothetical protein